jgi:hypothetical protein
MMTLEKLERLSSGLTQLDYSVEHATPGRDGTCLKEHLTLFIGPTSSLCAMEITNCEGATHKEALDRMATWLRRLADGIDQRKEVLIPM